MKRLIIATALLLLSACNTMQGLGEDMKAAGGGLSNSASSAKTY